MDDLIFQEFKGTGNMELVLNRRIAEQYIFPAVDILKSGTRREELIMPEAWLYKMNLIRRALAGHKPVEAMERFLFFLNKYPSNTQMLLDLKQKASVLKRLFCCSRWRYADGLKNEDRSGDTIPPPAHAWRSTHPVWRPGA